MPKVAKSGQKWSEVVRSGQKWSEVAKSGQKWPIVAKSGQKWLEFSEDLGNPSFQWEKVTEECIKNAAIACGIVDKHGSYDVLMQFSVFFWIFLFENGWEWSFWSVDWWTAWKTNSEPFWTVSDRVGSTVLVGLEIGPWRRDGTVKWVKVEAVERLELIFQWAATWSIISFLHFWS